MIDDINTRLARVREAAREVARVASQVRNNTAQSCDRLTRQRVDCQKMTGQMDALAQQVKAVRAMVERSAQRVEGLGVDLQPELASNAELPARCEGLVSQISLLRHAIAANS